MSDLVDKTLGEFRMLRLLGSGGMADVYLAEQTSLQRHVAVKVMKPSLIATSGEVMLARFKQEAMMAAGLNHPNIVQVYTVGEEDGYHYIAQELVKGKDLASIIKSKGVPDIGSSLHVIRQVTSALKAAGEVKVADFGLAQLHDNPESGGITREGMTLGTPLYMSPEQVSGKELDPRSDVYSFGVTCYQLLCGKTPFTGTSAMGIAVQHLNATPPPLKSQNPKLPDVICRMVHRMMAKRRSLRYQSAADVSSDLKKLISAYKQGRSLDLIKLPILEELDAQSKVAREGQDSEAAPPARKSAPAPDRGGFEISSNTPVGPTMEFESRSVAKKQAASGKPGKASKAARGKSASGKTPMVRVSLPSWEEDDEEDFVLGREAPNFEEMDLTPMVDVTFLLLIFFMITAAFNLQKSMASPPASSDDAAAVSVPKPQEPGVQAVIDPDNRIYIDDVEATSFEDMLSLLKAARSGVESPELSLKIDPESTHEKRINVADAATQAGFIKINSKIADVD
jgi:serine/threonine protein kinase/biopolymer transport protein ExbD